MGGTDLGQGFDGLYALVQQRQAPTVQGSGQRLRGVAQPGPHSSGLVRFVEYGELALSTNLSRLVGTCKSPSIDPRTHLAHVLSVPVDTSNECLGELTSSRRAAFRSG